jgi:hypothetical protein
MKNISPSPSIPQTPKYLALFIPCLNFDPTNQVILQKNPRRKCLSPTRRILGKGGGGKDQRAKEEKPHLPRQGHEKLQKQEDESSRLVGETFAKKVKMKITISYSAKFNMCLHPYPHITCICTIFQSLISLLTPFQLYHSLSTLIDCHNNSLEFFFAFTIYKVQHRYHLRVNHSKIITERKRVVWEDE